jgi:hypothetical protein
MWYATFLAGTIVLLLLTTSIEFLFFLISATISKVQKCFRSQEETEGKQKAQMGSVGWE